MKPWDETWDAMKADLKSLIGIPYRFGAEARSDEWPPKALDCAECVELVYARQGIAVPDGSWNQHAVTVPAKVPRPGDLGFFAKPEKARAGNPKGVYHVCLLFDDKTVVEARAKNKKGKYGRVIYRPRSNWEAYGPFKTAGGWRRLKCLV